MDAKSCNCHYFKLIRKNKKIFILLTLHAIFPPFLITTVLLSELNVVRSTSK